MVAVENTDSYNETIILRGQKNIHPDRETKYVP